MEFFIEATTVGLAKAYHMVTVNITETNLDLINQEAKFDLVTMGNLEFDLPDPDDVIVGENDIYKIDLTPI